MRSAFPDKTDDSFTGRISSSDATRQLLNLRSKAAGFGPRGEVLIRCAEYDLEVARSLTSEEVANRILGFRDRREAHHDDMRPNDSAKRFSEKIEE